MQVCHLNVNCSDLTRSLAFYQELGFTTGAHTAPSRPQPGAAFGLAEVQWDAWMMVGAGGPAAPVIDLLQWLVPAPAGSPYEHDRHVGFDRLRIAAPERPLGLTADPDGTRLEIVAGDGVGLVGVVVNCRDRGTSRSFYDELLAIPPGFVELVEIDGDDGIAPAYASANHLGIYRMALFTTDIDADARRLAEAGVRLFSPPAEVDLGPGLPPVRAVFFPDPDGATVELIEVPR